METILGIRGPDFVMLAADSTHAHSILVMKDDENKIHQVSDKVMLAAVGEPGDTVQFTEFIAKNIALYKMSNGYDLDPKSAAHFTRKNLADYLRSRTPYNVNLMLAGYDATDGPELHYIDYLANAKSVKYGGMGYGHMFVASIFDRYWNENLSVEDAYKILKIGVAEINKRLIINMKSFTVAIVDANGVRYLDKIDANTNAAAASS